MPMSIEDFPIIVSISLEIYNRLPDRYCSTDYGPLYIGKDLSIISLLCDTYFINHTKDKKLLLEIIQHIDSKSAKKDVDRINKLAKKSNSKNN